MNTEIIHYLTQDELKQLLVKVTSKRGKALLLLAYSYGLRASEIGKLRREDIDFQRLKIRIQCLKNSISSEYPLGGQRSPDRALAYPPTEGLIEAFARPDHNDEHQALGRVDLIYDAIRCAFVTEMVRPKSFEIKGERLSLVRVLLDFGEMYRL
ncbi:site-specific integrase [Candidatus Acetothermia bacterium]|jgi:hypothetical protein|nr:site-specific integrase [Candidatus Acetothermia bacterium]MCI2432164.1 site-specific integrase [Candidatus Acetothermia bacterium]MCI2436143.1 site-specific integrase [Candidatus Acetothermia bacterium]